MVTPADKRVGNRYCDYHGQKGHANNDGVQLLILIDKMVKEGKLDHLVKDIRAGKGKQKSWSKKEQPKDKADTIYMVNTWQRKTRQKVGQVFSRGREISFPPLSASNMADGPITIEVNVGGHDIHHMYVDKGSSAEILYEHCF